VAVFTGHDTKVMMNSAQSKPKFSKIEKATQIYIFVSILIQAAFCLFSALYTSVWNNTAISGGQDCDSSQSTKDTNGKWYPFCYTSDGRLHSKSFYYLGLDVDESGTFDLYNQNIAVQIIVTFLQWFLIMMNFVSISLLVSLELVKFFQGVFMQQDWMMFDSEKNLPAKVQSSNLNEELGMVHYVFSDKTGTLT